MNAKGIIKITKLLGYLLYLLAVLTVVFFLCLEKYKKDLLPEETTLSHKQIAKVLGQVGWQESFGKENRHDKFPDEKPENTIRIALLGDSFVAGMEIVDGYDIAAQMQKYFDKKYDGSKRIEVLNFAVSGHGLHQQKIMWDSFALSKEIDHVIFIQLTSDWINRDQSFASVANFSLLYQEKPIPLKAPSTSLHSRYIFDNGQIRLIDPVGISQYDRFRTYWSFWPNMTYLKFDNSTPMLARAVMYSLMGRSIKIKSPLYYYRGDRYEEQNQIRQEILKSISKQVKSLLYISTEERILKEIKLYDLPNLDLLYYKRTGKAVYGRPAGHLSALAYKDLAQLIAERFLSGSKRQAVTSFLLKKISVNLSSYEKDYQYTKATDEVYVESGEKKLATLYDISYVDDMLAYCKNKNCDTDIETLANVKSIVHIRNFLAYSSHMAFLGLDFPLQDQEIYWKFERGRNFKKQVLKSRKFAGKVFAELYLGEIYRIEKDKIVIPDIASIYHDSIKYKAKRIGLYFGEKKILEGKVMPDHISLKPHSSKILSIKGLPYVEDYNIVSGLKEKMLLNFYRDKQRKLSVELADIEWVDNEVIKELE